MKTKLLIILSLLLISVAATSQEDKSMLYKQQDFIMHYDFNNSDKEWELPKKLVEISGLAYIDENRLACIQDEKGNIYIYNTNKGEVEAKIDFGKDGDYEGIEIIGNDAWALRSNGSLHRIKDYLNEDLLKEKEFNTELSKKNDAEGLAYDPISNKILIACKGHPFVDEKVGRDFKAIYHFDMETNKLDLKPVFLIELDSIKYYKEYNTMTRLGVDLLAYIDESKGDLSFQPSGIAIHPITGDLYILAAVGNLMMIFSREGKTLAMIDLKSKHHPQPEGICFDPEGTLYIANEGDGGDGTIQKFKMKSIEPE